MMHTDSTPTTDAGHQERNETPALVAIALGALGIAAAVWAYWLVVPGVLLGIAAVVVGVRERRRGAHDAGGIAIALGVVALFLVPSVLFMVDGAEEWGRDCALHPANPDC